eukprot:TRINITY_DN2980_c0_g1_i1.p1 TRINITY_DN2980_c0_g1~~TRINITY_DN2980_c0_g1_i1.p1  ORF type:complete len:150 (+),score=47.59 TRINITY_DN2980_c0_g1_i1:208-657(+)
MSNNRQSNNRQSKNRAHDDEPKCVFPNGSSGGPETSALVDEVDRRQLVVLRDNRIFVGTLRSFDQFANIVLERTFERVYVGAQFGEVPVGLFIIRGENVMLFGRLDEDKEAALSEQQQLPLEQILELRRQHEAATTESSRRQQVDFETF